MIEKTSNWIYVTSSFIGFHRWKDAPDEVGFLRNKHRHKFNVQVDMPVFHDDREKEFFLVLKDLNAVLLDLQHLENMSCEMISDYIADKMSLIYKCDMKITVNEDGENGSYATYKWIKD